MNNSIILMARYNRMINSENMIKNRMINSKNMIKNWMEKQITY